MRDMIRERYKSATVELWQTLRGSNKVSIALDTWTSPNKLAFLSITAYIVNEKWEFQEHLIGFEHLSGAHTGENMAKVVMGVLKEYEIHGRLFAITADNASNNNTLRSHLTTLLRRENGPQWEMSPIKVPCLAHVIQLVVQEIVRHLKIDAPSETLSTNLDSTQLQDINTASHVGATIKKVGWREVTISSNIR